MIKGFIRLSIVVIIGTWAAVAFAQWKSLELDIWLIEQHISPHLNDNVLSNSGWPIYAADPNFLAMPINERAETAARFYDQHVRPLENIYFVGGLKQWMTETARLTLDEAPVASLRSEYSELQVPYRQFAIPGILVTPKLSYVLFSENVLILTPLISIALIFILIITTLIFRWIRRGFLAN